MSLKEVTVSLNSREFILAALAQGRRVDGRGPNEYRHVDVSFTSNGSVEASIGRTRVLAAVTADIIAPFPDRPAEGFLNFFVDFSPMASEFFESGRPNDRSMELARVVDRGIRDSRAIDTEALCILAGSKVWSVRCDIHVVDHDGNLTDCCNLAAVAALKHFRRPDVTVVGETVTIHSVEDKQPVNLSLHHVPVCVSFAFFGGDSHGGDEELCAVDPTLKEELVASGQMTITMNKHRELCCVQKSGGAAVEQESVLKCANLAAVKCLEIVQLIDTRLKEDDEKHAPQRRKYLPLYKQRELEARERRELEALQKEEAAADDDEDGDKMKDDGDNDGEGAGGIDMAKALQVEDMIGGGGARSAWDERAAMEEFTEAAAEMMTQAKFQ